jgi:hypothetical protein
MQTATMNISGPGIDHCVLPVSDLEVANARLSALGFSVAPRARHPFGTENCCVYFEDGAFIEPLAIGNAAKCAEAARKGNVFVARDQAFRFRRGDDGFSALVLTTNDAAADHARFKAAAISAGKMLRFSRAAKDKHGNRDRASFKLAFAGDLRSPDVYFFTCERVQVPSIDMSTLRSHANAVTGISAVIASEPHPSDFAGFISALSGGGQIAVEEDEITLMLGQSSFSVVDREKLGREFGLIAGHARGLRLRAILFKTANMNRTRFVLESAGIALRRFGKRLVVAPEPGQGAAFAFEEAI